MSGKLKTAVIIVTTKEHVNRVFLYQQNCFHSAVYKLDWKGAGRREINVQLALYLQISVTQKFKKFSKINENCLT